MTEFVDRDLRGARFERVDLSDAEMHRVRFHNASMRHVNLSGIDLRGAAIHGSRLSGVELVDVVITGELQNVSINGVDIGPLVDEELNRRMPDRMKMRPTDPDGFREAWDIVVARWERTTARARQLPEDMLHAHVDGEWSFIQTLRHLNFASAAWIGRMVLGDPSPWHALDLPWDEAPGWDGVPWDRDARPTLEEVLTVRRDRQAMVAGVIESLTPEQLASHVSRAEPGWPTIDDFPVSECVSIVLNEEWEHRNFAERDLDALGAPPTG
jgi:hypothetical protein